MVNELSATADGNLKRKLENLYDMIVNVEEALGSVAGGCTDLLEEIGLDSKY